MATTITAGNATNGLVITPDNTGILELKTGTGAGTTAVTVNTSQNVGIGTSSPNGKLDVNGLITARATGGGEGGQIDFLNPDNSATGLYIDVSTADVGRIFSVRNNSSLQLGQLVGTGGTVTFHTAAAERMRIDSSGNVLIGTTTQSTGAVLTVNGPIKGTITSGSAQTAPFTAPNTSCDFTGIPSWVKRITVMFSGVSTNGTSDYLIQIGDGSVNTSGYVAAAMALRDTSTSQKSTSTAGFIATADVNVNTRTWLGSVVLYLVSGNVWVYSGNLMANDGIRACVSGGNKTLSAALDRVRITTVNGTDTFDAGTINILYEG